MTLSTRTTIKAYLFVAFTLVFYLSFYAIPLAFTGYLSFHKWNLADLTTEFVGLKQYARFLLDPEGRNALKLTFFFMLGVIPLRTAASLVLAVLLNRRMWGRTFFRFAYFSPMVISFVAASMVWLWIYEPQSGLANHLLGLVGLPKLRWLADERLALPSLVILSTWKLMGYFMVIYLAGLQDIPATLYEAAEIDGAGEWKAFWWITLPLLGRVTTFVLIMSVILDFQVFEPIYVMTGGGPLGQTDVYTYYLYRQGFRYYDMSYASAVAFTGSAIMLFFTLIQWRLRKRD